MSELFRFLKLFKSKCYGKKSAMQTYFLYLMEHNLHLGTAFTVNLPKTETRGLSLKCSSFLIN